MSSTLDGIKGPIVAIGRIEAVAGKGDELAQRLANLKARANSKEEPGTLQYDIVRHGDTFATWEVFENPEAIAAHTSAKLSEDFSKLKDTLWTAPGPPTFWALKSLPEPTVRF